MAKSHTADKRTRRARYKARLEQARIFGDQLARSLYNRILRRQNAAKVVPEVLQRRQIINSMTNWQRNQAGKACKGKWDKLSLYDLIHFSSLPHWKKAGHYEQR